MIGRRIEYERIGVFHHHTGYTFKLEGTPEERRKVAESFKSALLALPSSIDVLQSISRPTPSRNFLGITDNVLQAVDTTIADTRLEKAHSLRLLTFCSQWKSALMTMKQKIGMWF